MRKKTPKPDGYDVYVETILYNSARKPVGKIWTLRTNGKATTDLEMARALTGDLTQMKVSWEIRNQDGVTIDFFERS